MQELAAENNLQGKQRWFYVILGILIMICLGTVYSWSVFRLPIEELYEIGSTQSGLPYMIALANYAFFMFLSGKYVDKYSPRLIISVGGFLVALGWILSAYASNIYVLTLTYGAITGAGVGIAYGAPITVVAKWFPEKKGLAVGLILIGFGLSPLVTAPLARNLIEQYGVMNVFLMLGICFGVIIPILSYPFRYPEGTNAKGTEKTNNTDDGTNQMTTGEMVRTRNFIGLYFNFVIGTMIGLMIIGMTTNVGVQLIKLSPRTVASLMSVFAIFNGMGRPLFGWLTDKLSTKKAMLLSYSLIATAAILMLIANEGSLVLFVVGFSIL